MIRTYADMPRVAYFCMEFGLNEELPVYAGGLGILAGDYIKAANDLNFPMVGIGILWRQDYTEQYINEEGKPYDVYPNYDYSFVKDTGVRIKVKVKGEEVECKIRMVDQYGNAPLYLLDTNFPGSNHGWITEKLYGGGSEERIAQEIVLGIGGVRALEALGIKVDIYHFNEGHAVLAGLELMKEQMQHTNFEEAWNKVREKIVFTTHTPVEAGNESHPYDLLEKMGALEGFTYEQVTNIGGDPFNMTVAALRLSRIANAVSKAHGNTTREMWTEVKGTGPIISITNGVHRATWQDSGLSKAFAGEGDLWEEHQRLKKDLINYANEKRGSNINPDSLIVGFARRATAYKRTDLIFRNIEVIEPLLKEGKLTLIFSGKAHPHDDFGKKMIEELVKMDRKYQDSVIFLENYNMEIATLMVQGCDIWLNNPIRSLEASGTSGMKAAMNGVLNLSVVDGWVCEGPQHGISGWLFDECRFVDQTGKENDDFDMKALYKILLDDVVPIYYNDRNRWVNMMKASIDMSHWQFCTSRMLREYYDLMYVVNERENEQEHGYWLDRENKDREKNLYV